MSYYVNNLYELLGDKIIELENEIYDKFTEILEEEAKTDNFYKKLLNNDDLKQQIFLQITNDWGGYVNEVLQKYFFELEGIYNKLVWYCTDEDEDEKLKNDIKNNIEDLKENYK